MIATLGEILRVLLFTVVLVGALPLVAALYQFLIVGLHGVRNHYDAVADHTPRTAVVVPAWNEAAVIGATIDRLVSMDYPRDALRVYVVDDASTDATPDVVRKKVRGFPGVVVHVRRERGGEGKAHTLNAGLERILADDWAEAVLIIDADVIFQRDALRRMTRHLADPGVGAVTAYIKEGSSPSGWMTRFIAFEYITAQAAARRAQNVLGVMMCLAGGAQLHSRANLEAIGGRIDTATLAEDTVTTFRTQRRGRLALFEGNAIAWAEEPNDIAGLWKQRLRWARGNVQITRRYRKLWFRRRREPLLGQFGFGVLWFVTLGMPAFMIAGSISLVVLFFINFGMSAQAFRVLWITNAIAFVFITLFSFAIDPATARRAWLQGLIFPGIVSLLIMAYTCVPALATIDGRSLLVSIGVNPDHTFVHCLILFVYVWLAGSMAVAWLAKALEGGRFRVLSPVLIHIAGYGPLLCAITLSSYIHEARGAEVRWEKTEKTGKMLVA
jgi:cellulose synthase/poly-beta-1,6-N-acetylglucosamine synthase-like glycosyltransferase